MKKLYYILLIITVVIAGCKKEDKSSNVLTYIERPYMTVVEGEKIELPTKAVVEKSIGEGHTTNEYLEIKWNSTPESVKEGYYTYTGTVEETGKEVRFNVKVVQNINKIETEIVDKKSVAVSDTLILNSWKTVCYLNMFNEMEIYKIEDESRDKIAIEGEAVDIFYSKNDKEVYILKNSGVCEIRSCINGKKIKEIGEDGYHSIIRDGYLLGLKFDKIKVWNIETGEELYVAETGKELFSVVDSVINENKKEILIKQTNGKILVADIDKKNIKEIESYADIAKINPVKNEIALFSDKKIEKYDMEYDKAVILEENIEYLTKFEFNGLNLMAVGNSQEFWAGNLKNGFITIWNEKNKKIYSAKDISLDYAGFCDKAGVIERVIRNSGNFETIDIDSKKIVSIKSIEDSALVEVKQLNDILKLRYNNGLIEFVDRKNFQKIYSTREEYDCGYVAGYTYDGKYSIKINDGEPGVISFYNNRDLKQEKRIKISGGYISLTASDMTGNRVAVTNGSSITIIDTKNWNVRELRTRSVNNSIREIKISPNGKYLIFHEEGFEIVAIKIDGVNYGEEISLDGTVINMYFISDRDIMYITKSGKIYKMNIETKNIEKIRELGYVCIGGSRIMECGKKVAALDIYGKLNIIEIETGEVLSSIEIENKIDEFLYNEKYIVVHNGKKALILDISTGEIEKIIDGKSYITRINGVEDGTGIMLVYDKGNEIYKIKGEK